MQNTSESPPLKVAIVGHVDHGKSTLVGRLIYETGSLPDGKYESIQAMCRRRGMPFEWAFLMDALQAERDQGITIDTAQIFFRTERRRYVIIDAPGHKEFLKNMVTGAASADAAVLVIDAREGVQEQSRRHGFLLSLLGVRRILVVVNKMDLVDYADDRFRYVAAEIAAYLVSLGLPEPLVIPASAQKGDGIAGESDRLAWHRGPTLIGALDAMPDPASAADLPLRLPVQGVYKFDDRRIIAGRIESGRLSVGDTLLFSPSDKAARVASIESWSVPQPATTAEAGQSVGITLDEQIFVERGHVASHAESAPIETTVFRARIFWLGTAPLLPGNRYKLKLHTASITATVQAVERVIDVGDLAEREAADVQRHDVAEIVLRTRSVVALDEFLNNPRLGRFVLIEDYDIVGGGVVSMEGYPDQRAARTVKSKNIFEVDHRVDVGARWLQNGHRSGILWLTGLSGAGKTTLALELEQQLFRRGYQAYVLDGDNVRHGLSSDLGFSPDDRAENIRRIGEVANLFAQAGVIVITAFISPYRADRDRVRRIAPDLFHEIHVEADLATCESRDPKGLYAKARAGEIKEFTGISAPYEPPEAADLTVDTGRQSIAQSTEALLDYVARVFDVKQDLASRS